MRCIYKVLFTRVHPWAEKVNAWGKCSPRCSPFGNLRLLQPSFLKAAANLWKKVETAWNPVPTYIRYKNAVIYDSLTEKIRIFKYIKKWNDLQKHKRHWALWRIPSSATVLMWYAPSRWLATWMRIQSSMFKRVMPVTPSPTVCFVLRWRSFTAPETRWCR